MPRRKSMRRRVRGGQFAVISPAKGGQNAEAPTQTPTPTQPSSNLFSGVTDTLSGTTGAVTKAYDDTKKALGDTLSFFTGSTPTTTPTTKPPATAQAGGRKSRRRTRHRRRHSRRRHSRRHRR